MSDERYFHLHVIRSATALASPIQSSALRPMPSGPSCLPHFNPLLPNGDASGAPSRFFTNSIFLLSKLCSAFLRFPKQMENTFCCKLHYWDASGSRVVGHGTYQTNIDKLTELGLRGTVPTSMKLCKSII